ncbi:MAG: hypothetical protein AABZ15_11630 [Nitrospirota bacterium]|mgnify:CR=1 FL=1
MKTLTIKKARQLIRKNKPNTEKMFEAMKDWPFRVRLSLAIQLLLGWRKGGVRFEADMVSMKEKRRSDEKAGAKKSHATDQPRPGRNGVC